MWNKKKTVFGMSALVFLCAFSVFPKEDTNQESDDSSTSTAAQPQVQTTSGPPTRFDPKKPILTMKTVKKLMEVDIQEKLLEKKLPEEFSKLKDRSELITNISFQFLMAEYEKLVKNPELPEVTRIHPKWYKAYGEKLMKFKPVVAAIIQAVNSNSANSYFLAVRDFKSLQEECLLFLKEPMPKITKEQYATLHKANTKQRALDYENYMKECRAAELKEAQEKKAKAAKKSTK